MPCQGAQGPAYQRAASKAQIYTQRWEERGVERTVGEESTMGDGQAETKPPKILSGDHGPNVTYGRTGRVDFRHCEAEHDCAASEEGGKADAAPGDGEAEECYDRGGFTGKSVEYESGSGNGTETVAETAETTDERDFEL